MDDIERCAQLLGMRRREVLEVVPVDGGDLVQTHDGTWTLVGNDGELTFGVAGPAAPVDAGEADPEDEPATKPAPKRQSRGRA